MKKKITIDQTNQEAVWILQPHSNLPKEKEAFKKEAKRRAKSNLLQILMILNQEFGN